MKILITTTLVFLCSAGIATSATAHQEDMLSSREYIARYVNEHPLYKKPVTKNWHDKLKLNAFSAALGTAIGFASGKLSSYLGGDSLGMVWLIVHYYVWAAAREKITRLITKDLDDEGTAYDKEMIESTARVADWTTLVLNLASRPTHERILIVQKI